MKLAKSFKSQPRTESPFLGTSVRNVTRVSTPNGFSSNIDRYLKEDLTVIVLCNIENITAVSLTASLAKAYFEHQ